MLRFNPESFLPPLRIYVGYTLFLFAMLAVPAVDSVSVGGQEEQVGTTGLAVTASAVAIIGVSDGLVQGSLFGMTAKLPSKFTQVCTP